MDNRLNFPPMNAFLIEDPDEPGTWAIPFLVMDGKNVMLCNIKKEKLDFFRLIVSDIAKETGSRSYFIEYDIPSLVEEIQPKDNLDISSILLNGDKKPTPSEMKNHMLEFIEKLNEIIASRNMPPAKNKPDDKSIH